MEHELLVKPNDTVASLSESHKKIGLMLLTFNSKSDMHEKMNNMGKLVKLKIDKLMISLSIPFLMLQEKVVILI